MISPSLAANLIKNMVQATVHLGEAWESIEDSVREGIVSDWTRILETDKSGKKEVALAVIARLTNENRLSDAWQKIDPHIRGQQVGLITEVVGNLEM